MGYFSKGFGLGVGATLGSIATVSMIEARQRKIYEKYKKAYTEYRASIYDPVVRNDLNEILAFSKLKKMSKPFVIEKQSFVDTYIGKKALFIIPIIGILTMFTTPKASDNIMDNPIVIGIFSIAFLFGIWMLIKRGRLKKQKYKPELEQDGEKYWYVREYIRQALESGEMNRDDAVRKLSNTALVQQFPDTVEEIEANAFYYKQQLLGDKAGAI